MNEQVPCFVAERICDACKKAIKGGVVYHTAGRTVCPECYVAGKGCNKDGDRQDPVPG